MPEFYNPFYHRDFQIKQAPESNMLCVNVCVRAWCDQVCCEPRFKAYAKTKEYV